MARFLFWNINRRPIAPLIASICHSEEIDVLILAESEIPDVEILLALNAGHAQKFSLPFNLSPKLKFYLRFPPEALKPIHDEENLAIRSLRSPLAPEILLASVHLPSKMWKQDEDQAMFVPRIASQILEAEKSCGHRRTIVVGDFNMDPFETGLVNSEGFHATMDRKIAAKGGRIVQGEFRPFLYNPMWSLMGDRSLGPSGTYFRDASFTTAYFWHTFDQVLIRPELIDVLPEGGVRVLTSINDISLKTATSARPDVSVASDHFPLLFDLKIEELTFDAV